MARDASFIRQFIADFWDTLPKSDIDLLGAYWHGITMAIADMYGQAFEATLGTTIDDVQLFRTERWNKYALTSDTADIQEKTDQLVLLGMSPVSTSEDAVLFDTLVVSNGNSNIAHTESLTLVDEFDTNLTYGSVIRDTLRVMDGSALFVEGRDYDVNLQKGVIRRTNGSGIPTGTSVTLRYSHEAYKENVDYVLDRTRRTITRVASGNIGSGDTVHVTYDYDNSTPDKMTGKGAINLTLGTLTDPNKNFIGVTPGRTLEITSGVNAGSYAVHSVLSQFEIKISGSFVADDPVATYEINAFPYAISTDKWISSVPTMQNLIVDPTLIVREDVDYQIGDGKISFRSIPPVTRELDGPTWWAEETYVDKATVYRNFGVLIDFYRRSSSSYLDAIRGIWHTYWTGSSNENIKRGLQILLGLPFATEPLTVMDVERSRTFMTNVSASADIFPEDLRTISPDSSDSITAPSTIYLANALGSHAFTASDVGRLVRISGSSAGNNGYHEIQSIVSAHSVTVLSTLSSESSGFSVTVHEKLPVDRFRTSAGTFSIDDLGRVIRIESSTFNNGDYEIAEVLSTNVVRIVLNDQNIGFPSVDGPGGFSASVYDVRDSKIVLEDEDGVQTTYDVPTGLQSIVSVGDKVETYQRLTDGVDIYDKAREPGFVENRLGRSAIQRFLTQNASKGPGNSDETKALDLLENHLWIPQVLTSAMSENTNVNEVFTFLANMKPEWSEYIFSFADYFNDQLTIGEDLRDGDISITIDLTTIWRNAWPNTAVQGQTQYQSSTGAIVKRAIRTPSSSLTISAPSRFSASDGEFTKDDEGRTLVISGSSLGNNGDYVISRVLSNTELLVAPSLDFAADESVGLSSSIQVITGLQDAGASFLTDAALGDIVEIAQGTNLGRYRVLEVLDNANLTVFETAFSGPFAVESTGESYEIVSSTWHQSQGAVDLLEGFIHERADGAVTGASTFTVDSSVDLLALGAREGMILVIKSGANMEMYTISSVSKHSVTVSGTFPSNPSSPEDYAICVAAAKMVDSTPSTVSVVPI